LVNVVSVALYCAKSSAKIASISACWAGVKTVCVLSLSPVIVTVSISSTLDGSAALAFKIANSSSDILMPALFNCAFVILSSCNNLTVALMVAASGLLAVTPEVGFQNDDNQAKPA
jgi:hypothetical protein